MVFSNHLQKSQIFFIILFHKSIAQFILGITFEISNENKMENVTITTKRKWNGYYYLFANGDHVAYLIKADDFDGWDIFDLHMNFMNDGNTKKQAIEKFQIK